MEYTTDSTAQDPIVRIRGQASSGEYDFICHINDIDPEQASYAEMCALWGHLRATGEISFQFGGEDRPVIPYGVDTGNILQRQNYMSKIDKMTTSQMFDQANQISAKNLLNIYQNFIDGNGTPNIAASNSVAQMGKLTDTVVFTDSTADLTLRAAYDQLSIESKSVLDRMNAGEANITQDEWTELCRELKDAGLITKSDFMHTRANLRIMPIGYKDSNGNAVLYDNPPILSGLEMDTHLSGYSGLSKAWTVDDWSSDPLSYFDSWIESLRKWRNDLAIQRNEDGTRKYDDLSSIGNNISSCEKVTNLMKTLMRFC